MRALRCAFAAALLAVTSAQQCFERYQCIFHHDVNGVEYSWDLHQLCRGPGQEYSWLSPTNQNFSINVCGNTSTLCAPGWNTYSTIGMAVQKWTDDPVPCQPCYNADTRQTICCTGQCAVLGTEFFQFTLLDPTNPQTGVQLQHVGMPPDPQDPTDCPTNILTGLPRERQITLRLYCDPTGASNSIKILRITELLPLQPCQYVLEASTAAACGVAGDPFDPAPPNQGPIRFGYVVLGATLFFVVYFGLVFANSRGWLDPIKRVMPSIPFLSGGGSYKSASFGGSSSYKTVSSATPIAASAYGST